MKSLQPIVLMSLCFLLVLPIYAQENTGQVFSLQDVLPQDPAIVKGKLDNGLTFFLM